MSHIESGRELRERLLHTTEDSKVMEVMKELVIKQQEDIFFMHKRVMELSQLLDEQTDIIVKIATGTTLLGSKLAPFLKSVKEGVKIDKQTVQVDAETEA